MGSTPCSKPDSESSIREEPFRVIPPSRVGLHRCRRSAAQLEFRRTTLSPPTPVGLQRYRRYAAWILATSPRQDDNSVPSPDFACLRHRQGRRPDIVVAPAGGG